MIEKTALIQFILLNSFLLFASCPSAQATTNFSTKLSGSVDVRILEVKHFRHSADCYAMAKGKETYDKGEQTLSLLGDTQQGPPGTYQWTSDLQSPFSRRIRTVSLQIQAFPQGLNEKVSLEMTDDYSIQEAQYHRTKCGHSDGITRPSQALIEGELSIEYTVPEGVWALQIERSGSGLLATTAMKPVEGILNQGFDKNLSSKEILWVQPGSKLIQKIIIPKNTPGRQDLGKSTILFKPLVSEIFIKETSKNTFEKFRSLQENLHKQNRPERFEEGALDFITFVAGALYYSKEFGQMAQKIPTHQLAQLSHSLFESANAIYNSPRLGLGIKTAAALGAYELALQLLKEMETYCKIVDVHLPLSNRSVQILGLRAAGFWLTRGLASVKNFSFDEYDSFLSQLMALEAAGLTYAQVSRNPTTMGQIQKAYDLLTEGVNVGASPFGVALRDVQRTLKQFGSIGAGSVETTALIQKLTELDRLESRFVQDFFESLDYFPAQSQEIVKARVFAEQLAALKREQQQISSDMTTHLRLLSADRVDEADGVMRTMVKLLSHQVALFEEPIQGVPYFEKLRQAYLEKNNRQQMISKIRACVLGGE